LNDREAGPAGIGAKGLKPCTAVCKQSVRALDKKKGQPVKVGLSSLGTRMDAKFPEMVPGAGLEPARLAAGDFESPLVLIPLC